MESKQKRTRVVASVLALAGLAVFSLFAVGGSLEPSAPPGPTMKTLDEVEPRIPIHASDLPLTITEPNSYYLAEDIDFTDTLNDAITIECNDVTIDLMGFTLKGPDSGATSGIYMYGRTNVEIRNGTVRDFYRGIREGSIAGRQHRIINVRAMSNLHSGIYLYSSGNLVKNCTVAKNGNDGIYAGHGSTVTGNTCYNNGADGITVSSGCTIIGNTAYENQYGIYAGHGSTVTGNTAYNNGNYGIDTSNGSTVTGNTAYNNDRTGISISAGSTVTGNTVKGNNQDNIAGYAGIRVYSDCLVKGNTLNGNLRNNIYVDSSDNAIEENLVTDCLGAGNGIYFNSAGNFYANNRASGNSTNYGGSLPVGGGDGGGNASF